MNEQIEFLLNEYVDGELTGAALQQAERLLAESAEARAFVAELRGLSGALEQFPERPFSTDLTPIVLTKMAPDAPAWWMWGLLGVQLVGGGLLALLLWPTIAAMGQNGRFSLTWTTATNRWLMTMDTQWQQLMQTVADWLTQLQNSLPSSGLASSQWGWTLVIAFLTWIVLNQLLLRDTPNQQL